MIEMDISFDYFGVRIKEICKRYHVGPVGPTPGHMVRCCHTGVHVDMTHHWSKEAHSRPIRSKAHGSKGPQPRDHWLGTLWAPSYPPWDPPGRKAAWTGPHRDWPTPPGWPTPPWGPSRHPSTCQLAKSGARCLPEYSFEILQLLMEDSPTWPPLLSATCHHLICGSQGSLELLWAYK
jgi:hypothetical protein